MFYIIYYNTSPYFCSLVYFNKSLLYVIYSSTASTNALDSSSVTLASNCRVAN